VARSSSKDAGPSAPKKAASTGRAKASSSSSARGGKTAAGRDPAPRRRRKAPEAPPARPWLRWTAQALVAAAVTSGLVLAWMADGDAHAALAPVRAALRLAAGAV
jgi:hypothetical protein